MTTRIAIDLNVRVRGQQTYAGFEDVDGDIPHQHDRVEVFERESGVHGKAEVTEIDEERRIIYLAVDWTGLADHGLDIPGVTGEPGRLTSMYAITESRTLPQSNTSLAVTRAS